MGKSNSLPELERGRMGGWEEGKDGRRGRMGGAV